MKNEAGRGSEEIKRLADHCLLRLTGLICF